jgi:hypothetical protein
VNYTQPSTDGISIFERNILHPEISDTTLPDSDIDLEEIQEETPMDSEPTDNESESHNEDTPMDSTELTSERSDTTMSGSETEDNTNGNRKRQVSIPKRFQTDSLQDTPEGRALINNRNRRN